MFCVVKENGKIRAIPFLAEDAEASAHYWAGAWRLSYIFDDGMTYLIVAATERQIMAEVGRGKSVVRCFLINDQGIENIPIFVCEVIPQTLQIFEMLLLERLNPENYEAAASISGNLPKTTFLYEDLIVEVFK